MDNINEMSLEEMEVVTGGAESGSGRVEEDGTVLARTGPDVLQVDIGGQTITATPSGKLRMNFVKLMPGDRVRVDYTPGSGIGRITWRYR